MSEKAVKASISGRVQGVGYRAWTSGIAKKLGLDGWVRNRKDGTVEALFKGPHNKVQEMLRLCHKGPPTAKVDAVNVENALGIVESGFRQLPTV